MSSARSSLVGGMLFGVGLPVGIRPGIIQESRYRTPGNNNIIEGLSLLQSIPPTMANKQTNSSTKERGSMARKLLKAKG